MLTSSYQIENLKEQEKTPTNVRLEKELRDALDEQATRLGTTRSAIIRSAIEDWIVSNPPESTYAQLWKTHSPKDAAKP